MRTLLQIFQEAKEILCRYDYYIHTQKRILHLTNSEIKIPHLMGMLKDSKALLEKCTDKREKNLVMDFLALWKEATLHTEKNCK